MILKLEVLFDSQIIKFNTDFETSIRESNSIDTVSFQRLLITKWEKGKLLEPLGKFIKLLIDNKAFLYRVSSQYVSINYRIPEGKKTLSVRNSIHICFFKTNKLGLKLELNIPNSEKIKTGKLKFNILPEGREKNCRLKGFSKESYGFRYHIFKTPEELESATEDIISIFNQIKEIHLKSIEVAEENQ